MNLMLNFTLVRVNVFGNFAINPCLQYLTTSMSVYSAIA